MGQNQESGMISIFPVSRMYPFFFRIFLDIPGLLLFNLDFRMSVSVSMENHCVWL